MPADPLNAAADEGRRILRRVAWRLIPLLGLSYIAAYLDRINVGFAALQMNQDLRLGALAYGTGAGIFFLGYVLFEIPSNLMLQRFGARRWIARIMVSWGLVSMAMALVRDEWSFYLLRFLLGVAEAGFFPGVVLYLTCWFPARERARIVALFATATALAGLIGSPLSGLILTMDGVGGWRGWHWLFVLEGLPAIALGLLVLAVLPDRPDDAEWLSPAERAWLAGALQAEQGAIAAHGRHTLRDALTSGRVWLLGIVYLCMVIGMYGIVMWLPQMLRALTGADALSVGLLNALPFLAATVGMVAVGWHSDRRGERRWHVAGSLGIAALGCALAAAADGVVPALAAFCLAATGVWAVMGPFWALATGFFSGTAAAAGIALINSLGNVGGFLGPYLMGWLKQTTAGYGAGLLAVAAILLAGAALAAALRPPWRCPEASAAVRPPGTSPS
jgi:ACS family tartrate transporter-like MFS transporter